MKVHEKSTHKSSKPTVKKETSKKATPKKEAPKKATSPTGGKAPKVTPHQYKTGFTATAKGGAAPAAGVQKAGPVSEKTVQEVTKAVIQAIEPLRGSGVGPMSEAAMSTAIRELSTKPEFQNPDGTVNQQKVMDYSVAICANVFTGKEEVLKGLDRIPGRSGEFYDIMKSMPAIDSSMTGGQEVGKWRAELDTSKGKNGLLADFDDGSGGQARHTWVFITMGYAAPFNALSQTTLLAGNAAHEVIEPVLDQLLKKRTSYEKSDLAASGGSRQDFAASWSGGAFGQLLHQLRTVMDQPDRNPGYNAELLQQLPSMTGGFFTGTGPGGSVASQSLQDMLTIPLASLTYSYLPWADTGRQGESQLGMNR